MQGEVKKEHHHQRGRSAQQSPRFFAQQYHTLCMDSGASAPSTSAYAVMAEDRRGILRTPKHTFPNPPEKVCDDWRSEDVPYISSLPRHASRGAKATLDLPLNLSVSLPRVPRHKRDLDTARAMSARDCDHGKPMASRYKHDDELEVPTSSRNKHEYENEASISARYKHDLDIPVPIAARKYDERQLSSRDLENGVRPDAASFPREKVRNIEMSREVRGVKRVFSGERGMSASRRHSVDSDIIEHLAECRCPCEHLGYSTYQDEATLFPPDVTRADNRETLASFLSQTDSTPSSEVANTGLCASDFPVAKIASVPRPWMAMIVVLVFAAAVGVCVPIALRVQSGASLDERLEAVARILRDVPLIDGHNDLPWNIRKFLHNRLEDFRFGEDLRGVQPWSQSAWSHTDLPRLRLGLVGAQIWAAYVPCESHSRDAVQLTLEQVDVIRRLTEKYHPSLTLCTSAAEIEEAHARGQVCSLISVEGGHSLGNSLPVLRTLYAVGVRGLTLTSTCNTPWADSSLSDDPGRKAEHGGLTSFGKSVVREMNRLGMLVDLSHVSERTMRAALAETRAPVLFSHSSARALCNSSRNVPDHILRLVGRNRGLVMVNFYSQFLTCKEESTVEDAVAHINHVRAVAGVDSVGLGAGYDGINSTPRGLEDVSTYPLLLAHLLGDGWSEEDLMKLAGKNFLRVLHQAETVRDAMKVAGVGPIEDDAPRRKPDNCSSPYI